MWQDILMMIAISLAIYSIYNFSFVIVKKVVSISKVSKKIYKFRGRIKCYPLIGISILILNLIGLSKKSEKEIFLSKYMLSLRLERLYNEAGILNKWLIVIFGLFLLVNFVLSIYIKPVMYEEGIVCDDGRFLPWDKIKSIKTIQGQIGNGKYIVINTMNNKEILLRVTNKETNNVKEIIFNKTGMVNKDIVTEFN